MNSLGDYACMSLWVGEGKEGRGVVCHESHFGMCPLVSLLQSHSCQERGFAVQLAPLCRVCRVLLCACPQRAGRWAALPTPAVSHPSPWH